MTLSTDGEYQSLVIMVAGAKGAIGTTLAAAITALRLRPKTILPWMTTANLFSHLSFINNIHMVGWDIRDQDLTDALKTHGVLPEHLWEPFAAEINDYHIIKAPSPALGLENQVAKLSSDMKTFKSLYPQALPVFINLLPAAAQTNLTRYQHFRQLFDEGGKRLSTKFPDLAYVMAAILTGIPVVNFTPNKVEIPAVISESLTHKVLLAGRDGKTGQTYFKMVLASALKARNLYVDGWYSVNILGNKDGENLMDPEKAASKVANKTHFLDDILGYNVGEEYPVPTHKVRIDYYPPRGDAKEAWDVIDFKGLFGLPMSIRLNFQARDSILAAPMVLDLSRWMAALQMGGRCGPVPELGFYFKKPVGENPPVTFQEQTDSLNRLGKDCR
jgi:myo-inositol-1-phosphate synthase